MNAPVVRQPQPSDLVSPDVEWFCWHPDGWESAGEGSVADARTTTRGQAAARFAFEACDFRSVRVWKRYVRIFARQDIWDGPGVDRWVDDEERRLINAGAPIPDLAVIRKGAPATPPSDWEPREYDGVWQFVARDHPDAIPVWICGVKGDEAPQNP